MKLQLTAAATFASLFMTGCLYGENKQFFEQQYSITTTPPLAGTGGEIPVPTPINTPVPTATPITAIDPTPTPPAVCDPFGTGQNAQATNGIKASMYYYNDEDVGVFPANEVSDLYTHGHKANADFFFNNLNVPTRAFDQGFQLENGSLLAKSDGTKLFEWFAFKFKTNIRLPKNTGPKMKQFALLTDDGSNMLVQDPITHEWSTQVANDGQHASNFGCGTAPVEVSSQFSLPIEIQYYQGPRYHIALMLLWRDWESNTSFKSEDRWCGQSGNSMYFDSSVIPSAPTSAWLDLASRWEVVPSDVFFVDEGTVNPCH